MGQMKERPSRRGAREGRRGAAHFSGKLPVHQGWRCFSGLPRMAVRRVLSANVYAGSRDG
jgi:hypothetical protein